VKRSYEDYSAQGQNATMWDAVFLAMVGSVVMGVAEFLGRLIGWFTHVFKGGILGLLISPLFAGIVAMAAAAGGFALSIYGAKYYLENQGIKVDFPRHSMYYAQIFLPIILVNALVTFMIHAVPGVLACLNLPLILGAAAVGLYGWYMLKTIFDRVYGTDNNLGLIVAAISVGGWVVGAVAGSILLGIFRI
jgi:hypothetical protein